MPALRERLVAVNAGLERARHLTEQLLNLARSQAGNSERSKVDLAAVARELIAENWNHASARGIDLGMEELAQLTVAAEPESLRMILRNALDNALRYSPPGGQVTIRLSAEGDDAIVDVIDSGPGIPPADRERAFSPFFRMPGSSGDGSGLGLAIARDAAARLGGVVSLENGPAGVGLVFRYRQSRVH